MDAFVAGLGYRLQPRIMLYPETYETPSWEGLPTAVMPRDSESTKCHSTGVGDTCQKPITTSSMTLPIALGVAIPIVAATGVLYYLHRRGVRRQRAEDARDPTRDLDFGIHEGPIKKKGKRRTMLFGGEKTHKTGQLSMDMNLASPYLLPPAMNGSHESIQTLTRQFPIDKDPYAQVPQYLASDAGSIRSFGRDNEGSTFGASSRAASINTSRSPGNSRLPPPRPKSMTRSVSTDEKVDPFSTPTTPEPTHQPDWPAHAKAVVPEIGVAAYPDEDLHGDALKIPDVQPPPPTASTTPSRRQSRFDLSPQLHPDDIGVAHPGHDEFQHPSAHGQEPTGLGLDFDLPKPTSPPAIPSIQEEPMYGNDYGYHGDQPQIQTTEHYDEYVDYDHTHPPPRQTSLDFHGQVQGEGLGVPQQDSKRLSIGFRPLPPDEIMESEDPEYRANRIRSFYKEYFEDIRDPAPPMPNQHPGTGGAQYYEDYDESYLGDAAYYDADTNAFVMPYAEPVSRRAMTPPPGGRPRGPPMGPGHFGPRPPHIAHGSIGGYSLSGGQRRPRAGSAFGPRSASAMGPRSGSSASGAWARQQKKKGPPPAPLSTLPTPSMLKDDSFALLGAMEFAPPETYGSRARGRSQSPMGERRPYQQPKVPVASPLVGSYDELAVLPSPHLLRKSSTFTGLDFAPPKKFREGDSMSDAGSIRSNRSGLSAAQSFAIREGAGRISRLPGDQVFTQAALADQLRPRWDVGR